MIARIITYNQLNHDAIVSQNYLVIVVVLRGFTELPGDCDGAGLFH